MIRGAVFLLIAFSSFVMVEPAPYDVAAIGIAALLFASGLRIPATAFVPILLLLLFAATNMLSILFADPHLVEYNLTGFARYAGITLYLIITYLLFLGFVNRYGAIGVRTIWNGWTIAGILAAIAGIYGYHGLGPGAEELVRNDRAKGLFKDPNVLGPFLVPILLHHTAKLIQGERLLYGLRGAIIILFLYALLVTFSRGAWANGLLAYLVFLPLLFTSLRSARQRQRLILLVSSGAILLTMSLAYLSTTPALEDMIEKRANLVNRYDVEEGGRFDTQRKLIPYILAAPAGHGPNQITPSTAQAPHNVYLKTYSEYGWLGGGAWLAFSVLTIIYGFLAAIKRSSVQRDTIVVFSSTLAITIQGLTIDTLHWRHLFLLLGMLWALIGITRMAQSSQPSSSMSSE